MSSIKDLKELKVDKANIEDVQINVNYFLSDELNLSRSIKLIFTELEYFTSSNHDDEYEYHLYDVIDQYEIDNNVDKVKQCIDAIEYYHRNYVYVYSDVLTIIAKRYESELHFYINDDKKILVIDTDLLKDILEKLLEPLNNCICHICDYSNYENLIKKNIDISTCDTCNKTACESHVNICQKCKEHICDSCIISCWRDNIICKACSKKCVRCKLRFCDECFGETICIDICERCIL